MDKLPVNAQTLNAMFNVMAGIVFATVRQLPADRQAAFAQDLAGLAKNAEKRGETTEEMFFIDLHALARVAPDRPQT
ncbi:hypothetical protein [Pseudaquabacterium pictum]|uniref:Uncharacterized protein n=1 Tax=Pseudaquabacterium pictum TaxID=2315236 RepID=A0A480AIE1_9BURK|nr:hypothetical protein [Rubrivivax pictus]GCL61509.1 hypothetical protein AQPW35_05900 [Rubrivivax pictus]